MSDEDDPLWQNTFITEECCGWMDVDEEEEEDFEIGHVSQTSWDSEVEQRSTDTDTDLLC